MIHKDVVLKHIVLANKIAESMSSKHPADRDDIFSAAYYGLVKASRMPHPQNGYVVKCIRTTIRDALEKASPTLQCDRVFLADYLSHSGNMEDRAAAMGLEPEYVFKRLSSMTIVVPLHHEQDILSRQESQLEEMLEVCLQYLPDRLRRTFLLQFRDQYTCREIAHLIGVRKSAVHLHLKTALEILRANKQPLADLLY